ncbi:MAG: sulfatase-like hydrolase/transferase, partial [Candidatus Competibacteraceae bacterium]|nr:sulfatase-like hydrolase/transferase [Candidatus Competibacteraceae bacterium]
PYADYLTAHGLDPWADLHNFSYGQHLVGPSNFPAEHHQTTWVADRTIDFLEELDPVQSFFVWNSFIHPHHPFNPPAPWHEMYDSAEVPSTVGGSEAEIERWPESYRKKQTARVGSHEAIGMDGFTELQWREIRATYYGMVSFIDAQVQRIMQTLQRLNRLQNTTIVFTSDHGEMLGDHRYCSRYALRLCHSRTIARLPGGGRLPTRG